MRRIFGDKSTVLPGIVNLLTVQPEDLLRIDRRLTLGARAARIAIPVG
jgi:hypothetical protein